MRRNVLVIFTLMALAFAGARDDPFELETAWEAAVAEPLTGCPECHHDVDHFGACPKGCPLCTPVAITRIGTNIVYDHGTEERARVAFDWLDRR